LFFQLGRLRDQNSVQSQAPIWAQAPDNVPPNIPLSDFFQGQFRSFTSIAPAVGKDGNYFIQYFINNANQTPTPAPIGPDEGDED
jgi:hypothetical protein